ncbi:MAG: hypothetical protein N2555_03440 [Endomicrobia bacterium]|nr:hypothetical protein [Endomicrobiia bacterium]
MVVNVFKKFTDKVGNILNEVKTILKQDTVYGIRLGQAKIKEIKLEQKKLQKLIEIGRKAYVLYKKGLLKEQELQKLCNQLEILETAARTYHNMADSYKKKIKFKL